jgi:hypothetical protein
VTAEVVNLTVGYVVYNIGLRECSALPLICKKLIDIIKTTSFRGVHFFPITTLKERERVRESKKQKEICRKREMERERKKERNRERNREK